MQSLDSLQAFNSRDAVYDVASEFIEKIHNTKIDKIFMRKV